MIGMQNFKLMHKEKSSEIDAVASFNILRSMLGFNTREFVAFCKISLPLLKKELSCACVLKDLEGVFSLSMRLILFLRSTHLRCVNFFQFFKGLVGFDHRLLCAVI